MDNPELYMNSVSIIAKETLAKNHPTNVIGVREIEEETDSDFDREYGPSTTWEARLMVLVQQGDEIEYFCYSSNEYEGGYRTSRLSFEERKEYITTYTIRANPKLGELELLDVQILRSHSGWWAIYNIAQSTKNVSLLARMKGTCKKIWDIKRAEKKAAWKAAKFGDPMDIRIDEI
jgi:hypothetical protein